MTYPLKYIFINFIFLLLFFTACKATRNHETIVDAITNDEELIIDDNFNLQDYKQIKYKVLSHQISGTDLTLKVKTDNVCGEQLFALYTTSALMKSLPPQKSIYLVCKKCTHECNKTSTFDLSFKLNVLKSVLYETIVLNIDNYDEQIVYKNKYKTKL